MSRVLAHLCLFVVCAVGAAAPVPKSLKRPTSPDGTWKLVEFWSDGQKGTAQGMTPVWVLEGEAFYVGPKQESNYWMLSIPDPARPKLRRFAHGREATNPYSAALEVEGDTLRFCYASNPQMTLTDCAPGNNIYSYVFARVKDSAPEYSVGDSPDRR